MTRRDLVKVVVFVLIPINVWLIVLYHQHQKTKWLQMWREGEHQDNIVRSLRLEYIRRSRLKIQVGMKMPLSFPFPVRVIGKPAVWGIGKPVLFLNISWITDPEVWELAINEALKINPDLQVVLLCYGDERAASIMWHKWNTYRLSILMSENWFKIFGNIQDGILAVFCDGRGVVQHIEPYPHLKLSPYWKDEVTDWQPKLHQAVKKVLDKFFPKGQRK